MVYSHLRVNYQNWGGAMNEVNGLHHVGHVVRDLGQAMETYRRLGFTVAPPAYPVLPGVSEEAVAVANAHVYFADGFVELVAVLDADHPPVEARPFPLRVPDDRLPGLAAAIRATVANIRSFADRFEGVHIMIADTSGIDGVASRLTASGVPHGGVHAIQRPVQTEAGTLMEPARYLEISAPDLPLGRVPEGRIGFAQNATAPADRPADHSHPNGAIRLVECVLCVDDASLPEVTRRYGTYFGQEPAVAGQVARFGRAGVTVVGASALGGLLPGERAAGSPAFVAYGVSVRDLAATERLLRGNDVPVTRTGPDELFVAALGTAVVFRQEGLRRERGGGLR